jgi:hypothetical protein
MGKIKLGDIFEINTPKGNAYLHYVYKHPDMGDLIRVLPGLFSKKPEDLDGLINAKENYMIYFPLGSAKRQKIVEQVGHVNADAFENPKYMRTDHKVRGEVLGWYIVDTETFQREFVEKLTPQQKKLSPWGIWNDTLLIQRLVDGWTLENWT